MAKKKLKPIELLRQQYETYKRTGKVAAPTYHAVKCYVCGHKAPKSGMRYIGKNKEGEDVYRHEHCEVGSTSWLKHAPKDSPWRKYFQSSTDCDQQEDR